MKVFIQWGINFSNTLSITEIPKDPPFSRVAKWLHLNYDIGVFKLIKITGNSLSPEYNQGDYLIITTISLILRALKTGDIVVFKHPVYGTMVKQVQETDPQSREIFVVGTNPESTDSRQFGPIPESWLTGKVLWHIPKPG